MLIYHDTILSENFANNLFNIIALRYTNDFIIVWYVVLFRILLNIINIFKTSRAQNCLIISK